MSEGEVEKNTTKEQQSPKEKRRGREERDVK